MEGVIALNVQDRSECLRRIARVDVAIDRALQEESTTDVALHALTIQGKRRGAAGLELIQPVGEDARATVAR